MSLALVCKSAIFLILTLKVSSMPLKKATDPKIYLYQDMFEDNYCCKNVAPKDVGAFKFYCIQDHLVSIVAPYAYIFPEDDDNVSTNALICKEYAYIKMQQSLLYHFFESQATANISNTTILSIVYMLQQAGESLQQIQYDNHQIYCPDYDDEIQTMIANQNYTIQLLFKIFFERGRVWQRNVHYNALFNSSPHIQYRTGAKSRCNHFISTLIMAIY